MASSSKPQIGWVGLGAMGFGMAANLVKEGYTVKGFDVWAPSIERFVAAGGVAAKSLSDSAKDCLFYVCMVASAPQAQDALFDHEDAIVKALPQGATLLLCSTVPASYAQSVAEQLVAMNRSDISFIDAPVSGGTVRAAAGTLTIMAGASASALEKGKFLLQEMSDAKKLFIVDGGVGQGSNMKMVHQILAGIQILTASEAMGLASRLGLSAEEVMQTVVDDKQGTWSWMFENRVPRMLKEDYYPGVSALTIILKDVSIITSQARLHAFPVPLVAAAEQAYFTGLSNGWGAHDDASMVRLYTPTALSTPPPSPAADPEAAMTLVKSFLSSVHAAAAAEALAFAHKLGISLPQFYELANDAAGGSAQFRSCGSEIVAMLRGGGSQSSAHTLSLDKAIRDLTAVADEAQRLKMPAFLTAATLQVFLLARRSQSGKGKVSGVVGVYGV